MLKLELKTSRIEALTDGVFAIAMTILVLSFEIDVPKDGPNIEALNDVLFNLFPEFLHYVESFFLLSAFWIAHHQHFNFIHKSDRGLLYINIVALLFICLIPFTTSLVGDYGDFLPAVLIFEGNMLIVGMIFFYHWEYASRNNRLIDKELDPIIVKINRQNSLVIPVISVAAILLSFIHPRWGTTVYLSLPILYLFLRRDR